MNADRDAFTDAIEVWLQEGGEQEHPSRVLDQVVTQLDLNQVGPHSARMQTIALAAAVFALVAFVGFNLVSPGGHVGGPSTSRSPSLVPTPTASPTPVPRPTLPPLEGISFIGLPPIGSTASSPDVGRLVDSYPVHGGGKPFQGMVRLYADGRMIWYMFYGVGNSASTGFLEQRLTTQGVELVRTHDNLAEKDPLRLAFWLPSSAWEDQQIRAYVPSGYAVCLMKLNPSAPIEEEWPPPGPPEDRSAILDRLPTLAADLLRDRKTLPPIDDAPDCLAFTTDDARLLDAALREAGLDRDQIFVLQYWVPLGPPGPLTERISITLEPRFPDGTNGCSACG